MRTLIKGGTMVTASDTFVADLWIEGGRIMAAPTDPAVRPDRTIDARGDVVMPAGVDVHCHIAGPKVNGARAMRPEEARRGHLDSSVIGRSGTLGYEAAAQLGALGIGVSTSVGIGGDPINGSSFRDHLARFEQDPDTDAVIMIVRMRVPHVWCAPPGQWRKSAGSSPFSWPRDVAPVNHCAHLRTGRGEPSAQVV